MSDLYANAVDSLRIGIEYFLKEVGSCLESSEENMVSDNVYHLEKAAKAGDVEAMLKLAPIKLNELYDPYPSGGESFQAGINYFEKAASGGNLKAVLALADIYENGWDCGFGGDFPEEWKIERNETERLENALGYYEQALGLGCEFAAKHIERIQKLL